MAAGPGQTRSDEKRERFVRLAEQRVNRTIRELKLIGNLSNRSAYSFEDEDVKKIFQSLQKEMDAARERFSHEGKAGSNAFRL